MNMKTVVFDEMAIRTGNPSRVGENVECIILIPAWSNISVSGVGESLRNTVVCRDVYLCKTKQSRMVFKGKEAKNIKIFYKGFEGNDLFSHKELGEISGELNGD